MLKFRPLTIMEFPSLINWKNPFQIQRWLVSNLKFHLNLKKTNIL